MPFLGTVSEPVTGSILRVEPYQLRFMELAKRSNWGTDASGASVESAWADVEVAAAELVLTKATLRRMSLLADQKAISQVERENAEAEAAFAEAKLRWQRWMWIEPRLN